MRGGTETKQAHPLSGLDAGDTQTAKTDDAGTQEGSSMPIIEGFGKGVYEISPSDRKLGIAPVHGITGKGWRIAKVFQVVLTVPAAPFDAADPGNSHPAADRKGQGGAVDHLPYNLVTGDELVTTPGQVAVDDMQIRPADATCAHAQ
jgi:hypothetical protein